MALKAMATLRHGKGTIVTRPMFATALSRPLTNGAQGDS